MVAHDRQAAPAASERGETADSEGDELRLCAHPPCTTRFEPAVPHQKYCCDNCRRRHFEHREARRRAEFVAEYVTSPEVIAEALREYDRQKQE